MNKLLVNYSLIEGIKIIEKKNPYDTNDRNDASTGDPDKDSEDDITKNTINQTEVTQEQEQSIPQNEQKTAKIDIKEDTKTNGHSQKVSQVSYLSCHYCSYQGKSESEVLSHSMSAHPGIPARPDPELLELIKNNRKKEQDL